jgi:V/A-type H+-transporting ATPase subunit F
MPNCIVLTDSETADGFRLAGVEVLVSRGGEETTRLVEKVMEKKECGLILMKEELMEGLAESLLRRLEKAGFPLLIPLPLDMNWWREQRGMEYLLRLIRRSIGYHLRIRQ